MFGNKRGVTPLVTSLLLLTVTVMAMLIATSLSNTIIQDNRAQMGERLCVEKVMYNATDIKIYLRNNGHQDITLENYIINGTFHDLTPNVVLPALQANPLAEAIMLTISRENGTGVMIISFFSSNNNELGRTEVDLS